MSDQPHDPVSTNSFISVGLGRCEAALMQGVSRHDPPKALSYSCLSLLHVWRRWSEVKVAQLCLTLRDPMDYTVHGILQARILKWVASPFSRDLPNPGVEPRSPALEVDSLPAKTPENDDHQNNYFVEGKSRLLMVPPDWISIWDHGSGREPRLLTYELVHRSCKEQGWDYPGGKRLPWVTLASGAPGGW